MPPRGTFGSGRGGGDAGGRRLLWNRSGAGSRGGGNVVIEVNPRLTTSYLGLRQIARGNLADVMRRIAEGDQVDLRFDRRQVQFATELEAEIDQND